MNRVSDLVRHSVAEAGFTEALTFTLCSYSDVAEKFGKDIKNIPAVHIANPKTQDFQVREILLKISTKSFSIRLVEHHFYPVY